MLDERSMQYAEQQLELLAQAARDAGYQTHRVSGLEAQRNVPMMSLDATSRVRQADWHPSCLVMPMHRTGEGSYVAVQLFLTLTGQVPEENKDDISCFMEAQNARLMFGNLCLSAGCVSLRYVYSYPCTAAPDPNQFQHVIYMLILQADATLGRLKKLVSGKADLEVLSRQIPLIDG